MISCILKFPFSIVFVLRSVCYFWVVHRFIIYTSTNMHSSLLSVTQTDVLLSKTVAHTVVLLFDSLLLFSSMSL